MRLEPGVTYYVESDRDDTVLLALDAKQSRYGIEWFDTVRDRLFLPVKLEETADTLSFSTGGARYTLQKLTLELYQHKVGPKVDGHRVFADTESVQRFYQQFPR